MDFGTRAPEINSGLLYSGPGSGSMMAVAKTWEGLAARLCEAVAVHTSAIAKLATGFQGPVAMTTTQVTAPYLGWLIATAARVQQTATKAAAAASAYESAFAATVPPTAIDDNRARRVWLASANCLGQLSPAIGDNEAEYERMWAQDADVMYAYASASAEASTVTPFTSPPTTGGPAGHGAAVAWAAIAAPEIMSAGYQVMSAIPEALRALCASPLTPFDASLSPVTSSLSKLSSLSAPSDVAIEHLNSLNKEAALAKTAMLHKAAGLRSLLAGPGGASGAPFTAGFDRGTSVGALSVPRGWVSEATPNQVTAELQRGWVCEPIRPVQTDEPPPCPLFR